jgi:hypothetical protein
MMMRPLFFVGCDDGVNGNSTGRGVLVSPLEIEIETVVKVDRADRR